MNPRNTAVIPSEVEGSRGDTLKVIQRDSSTPLRSAQNDSGAFDSQSEIGNQKSAI